MSPTQSSMSDFTIMGTSAAVIVKHRHQQKGVVRGDCKRISVVFLYTHELPYSIIQV